VHPFPSLLNAAASCLIAALAGADSATAARLGLSMLGLQTSIGALNDLVDEPLDAGQKPGKPVPRGLVTRPGAWVVTAITGVAGLALSVPSGLATLVAAFVAMGLGYVYDLRLSRTSLSWLPLAVALPVLPIHAWLGATGGVAPGLVTLVPAAVLAGTALAIANGLVDVERDATTGRRGIVVTIGPRAGWLVHAASFVIVIALALALAPAPLVPAGGSGEVLGDLRRVGLPVGIAAIALGAMALLARSPGLRERGWELEAVGVAAAGVAWLAGTAGASRPA
jgi:4-hydroxybenzoate polyprenyltransferase